ncbi:MAG TPA: cytochrome c biogenesis protein DipZ, partial [Steroidobacteraceae bacterium]|nr:cytochrome c biogenesis protein DipZ [Steroidobacteraceae bacterium]
MILLLLVYLGGVLTIVSPCILPVLPFVFARSEQKFLTSGLPMLVGMAATFAGIATLAAVGGAWAVRLNQYGRWVALALMAAFALTLLSRRLAEWLTRPLVALGNRLLPASGPHTEGSIVPSLLLGAATGLLWAPCAGPVLGLVLTGAALSGPNAHTTLLLFAYAAGAASSLAVAILAGGRVFAAMKKSLGAGEWIRRALGVAVLVGVATIVMGWDSSILTRLSLTGTNRLEQSLITRLNPTTATAGRDASMVISASTASALATMMAEKSPADLPVEGELPSLAGASSWLNSPALTPALLRGKVVLVDFWTYSCINCLRSLPYVKAWYDKYKSHGLVVIGVHAPEFAFEKDPGNVRRAVAELGVTYPVALDNSYAIWQGFNNQYWPAHYFIDSSGRIRGHHFGEGEYAQSEQTLRRLLTDAGYTDLPAAGAETERALGVQAAGDEQHVRSPETYIGYDRAARFASPGGALAERARIYAAPSALALNQWALGGDWTVASEKAALTKAPGKIVYRFYARDLHLVLGAGAIGRPVRFRVQLDGADPGTNHGADTDTSGLGVVKEQRLYQLIRQANDVQDHVFSIEFLDSGVQAYSFTFG